MNKVRLSILIFSVLGALSVIIYDKIFLPQVANIHSEIKASTYLFKKLFHEKAPSVSPESLEQTSINVPSKYILIDLRSVAEQQAKPVQNAFSLPYEELQHTDRAIFSDTGKKFIFLSKDGKLAEFVCMQLSEEGLKNVYYLEKGIDNWVTK